MRPIRQTDRAFGLMIGAALTIFALVLLFVFDAKLPWLFGIGGALFLVGLISPGALLPLNRLWGEFAYRLGRVNNFLLLGLFYYLFIFPVGIVFKLFGRDPLQRKINNGAGSYWQPLTRKAADDNYQDMF
jgi:hypothetical protein